MPTTNATASAQKPKKIKPFFDVVNSVKGGSGKSTFSLFLAACHALNEHTRVYVIDLDLRGTSWEKNYRNCIRNHDPGKEGFPYINDLLWENTACETRQIFVSLPVAVPSSGTEDTAEVKLCMCRPGIQNNIDDVEVDLFENAIFHLIQVIFAEVAKENAGTEQLRIVFDMPPSYEKHAEQILKHLLLSTNSELYKKAFEKNWPGFEPYTINLYMLAALSQAHIDQNELYVARSVNQRQYSSAMYGLTDFHGKCRLQIRFIGNDVTGVIVDNGSGRTEVETKFSAVISGLRRQLFPQNPDVPQARRTIPDFHILEHINAGLYDELFHTQKTMINPVVPPAAYSLISDLKNEETEAV